MSKKPLDLVPYISDLINNVYCRIAPSKVHGVGVIAIRDIPKGKNIFSSLLPSREPDQMIPIPKKQIFDNDDIPSGVKQMIHDFITIHDDLVEMPSFGLNELNISYYLNHSDSPNVKTDDFETFFAIRDIKTGEELFSHYGTYSEEELDYIHT